MATFPAGDKELQPGSDLQLPGQALNPCLPCRAGMWLGVSCIPTPVLWGSCLPWHHPPSTWSPTRQG